MWIGCILRAMNAPCFRSDIPDHNLSDNLDLIQVITDLLSESNLVLLFNNLEFSRTNERGI